MRLFSTIAYHSTSQKGLKKFDDFTSKEKAYKGEGAQVHGWGLYLQEDKKINIERYKNTLSEGFRPTVIITDKSGNEYVYKAIDFKRSRSSDFNFTLNGKPIEPKSYLDKILNSICYPYSGHKNELIYNIQSNLDWIEKQLKQLEIDKQYYTNKNEMTKTFIYDSRYHNESFYDKEGHYHDKVDEDEFYKQRNNFIDELSNNPSLDEIDYFYNLYKDLIDHVIKIKSDYCDERFNHLQKQLKFYKKQLDFLNTHEFEVKWEFEKSSQYEVEIPDDFIFLDEDEDLKNQNIPSLSEIWNEFGPAIKTGRELYENLVDVLGDEFEASLYLLNHGIDGIKYDGWTDGQCYVIFNCKELKILNEE